MNSPNHPTAPTKILVIDSDRDRWLANFLGRWGYCVCYAETGREGLEKATREWPHLILLEVEMPDLDGYDICRRLKSNAETEEIPVIFMGCREVENTPSRDRDILKGFAIGAVDYIRKPFHTSEVLARINHQLTRRELQSQLKAAKNNLEVRIAEQTAQLLAANDRLRQEIRERRESEEKFRQLAENIRDVFYIHEFDNNFKTLYLSPACEAIWGISREELYRNPYVWLESIHPDDRERVAFEIAQPEAVRDFHCEYRILRPDGTIRWIRDRAFPIRNERHEIYRLAGIAEDITERKQAQTRLHALNQRLEALITQRTAQLQEANAELSTQKQQWEAIAANIPDGAVYRAILRKDGTFSLIYISEGIEKITGRDRRDIQTHPQSLLELLAPQTRSHLQQYLQVALGLLEPSRFNFAIEGDNQSQKWLQNRSSFSPLENGDIVVDGLILDISDRIAAETALRESEERFRVIFEQTPTGINLTDSSGRFISINSKCCEIFGYDREELLTMRFQDITHPEDLPANLQREAQLIAGEIASYSLEKRFLRKDGTVRWGRMTISAIRDFLGTPKYFIAALEDIQDRKEWQATLERQIQRQLLLGEITAEIRQSLDSEKIFQTTANKIGEAFGVDRCVLYRCLTSPTLQVPLVAEYLREGTFSVVGWEIPTHNNPHLDRLLQREAAIASDDITRDPLLAPAAMVCVQLGIQSLLGVATFYNGEPNGVICLHQCHSQRHWTREESELIEAISAQVGIALAQADLLEGEKHRQEELAYKNAALKQATRAAEAASLAKSEFLANMSHEIRTPMNAILGFCDLLQERVTETRSQSYLESIKASGKTLLTLIDDLLDLSKIEAGKLQLRYEPIHLYGLIEEVQIFFSEQARQKRLQWVVEIAPDVPPFPIFDEIRLRQILLNVVGNALKFTECGGIKMTVTSYQLSLTSYHSPITTSPLPITHYPLPSHRQTLKIAIEDTGIGIAPEQQEAIFEAFQQNEGQSTRKYGGTGLGLAITKRLTEMLGGQIRVQSALGKGSMFTFIFPNLQWATDAPTSGLELTQSDRFQKFPPLDILVADDIPSNRNLIAGYFADSSHHLFLAKDGLETLEIARDRNLDLILLDLRMPELDGWEVARALKTNPQTRKIPLLILTAATWVENEGELRSLCDGFLRKPIDRDRLLAAMEDVIPLGEMMEKTTEKRVMMEKPPLVSGKMPENLPELLEKLQKYEQTRWQKLRKTLKMRDLKQFAEQIDQWGREYGYLPAIEYAATLSRQLVAFDWHKIPKTIENFPKLKEGFQS